VKSLRGPAAFKSSETLKMGSYDDVASEYYDAELHPTCADFRAASRVFLQTFFSKEKPQGRIADVGCGLSLLNGFVHENLVLVDSSIRMLRRNVGPAEKRLVNVEEKGFGSSEFDWVFAILADPFNSIPAWKNIREALRERGRGVFIVPSYCWVSKFRSRVPEERPRLARFVRADKSSVFLPSIVYSRAEQSALIESGGMLLTDFEQVFVRELSQISSFKISEFLLENDAILDVYCVEKV
jgi:hypothetical protein